MAGGRRGYVDEAGRPFARRTRVHGRAVTPIEQRRRAGRRAGARPRRYSRIPRCWTRSPRRRGSRWRTFACRPRCTTRVEQLAASRRRIVEAGDAQRRRLGARAARGRRAAAWPRCRRRSRRSRTTLDEPRARALLGDVETQLDAARAELSELARGIRPLGADDRRTGRGARGARPSRAGAGRDERRSPGAFPPRSRRPPTSSAPRRSRMSRNTRDASRVQIELRPDAGRLAVADRRRRRGRRRPARAVGPARSR